MPDSRFSIAEAISFGWTTVTRNLGLFLMAELIVCGISILPTLFGRFLYIVMFVAWVLDIAVALGFMRLVLRFVDGERGELVDLFGALHLTFSYFLATVLAGIASGIALVFLIIPGIYVGIRLFFVGWVLLDREGGPVDAMRGSWAVTKGSVGRLFLFGLALAGVNLLGALALVIGLAVTIPVSLVAVGHVYRRLEWASRG